MDKPKIAKRRVQVTMTDDEYAVFKAYARIHYSTIGAFARRSMKSEIRRRIRDRYWQHHPTINIMELAQRVVDDTAGEGNVYFILQGEYIKIGYSTDVERRMDGIMCDNPNELTLLACFPATMKTERKLHDAFSHCRYRNEWFHADKDIYEFINAMREIGDSVLKD